MREWINLFEDAGTITLYRGDSADIEKFELAKTEDWGLFGQGIYLTDSPDVAKDYTVKGTSGGDIEYRASQRDDEEIPYTTQALMQNYLRKLVKELGVDTAVETLKREFLSKMSVAVRDNTDWSDHTKSEQNRAAESKIRDEMNAAFMAERSKVIRTYVEKAKAEFKKRRSTLRIVKLTTGEYVLAKAGRAGVVSKFEVPAEYVARVLHTERPLTDPVLAVVREVFLDGREDRAFDLRVLDNGHGESMGHTFDSFVAGFKKHGARYAWTENKFGGKGENPSLDVLWNGTHSGLSFFNSRANQAKLMTALTDAGFVGLQYDGGIRLAGTGARGGGGFLHKAYVFWNEDDMNAFRVSKDTVQDDEVGPIEKGIRTKNVIR